jgi:hypothetical protein
MPYSAEISRKNPTAFVILIDQSGSMGGQSGINDDNGNPISKAQAVADAINSLLDELINQCLKADGIRDYFNIALIGYGKSGSNSDFVWEDNLKGQTWCTIAQIKDNVSEQETYKQETVIRGKLIEEEHTKNVWIRPAAVGSTPMKDALIKAKGLLSEWINDNINSFPPILINITDGAATDSSEQELIDVANDIKQLKTQDGNLLVFNCHIASSKDSPVTFPSSKSDLPDNDYAKTLFDMSSDLPPRYINTIIDLYEKDSNNYKKARGMSFNSSIAVLIKFLEIGTRPALDKDPDA